MAHREDPRPGERWGRPGAAGRLGLRIGAVLALVAVALSGACDQEANEQRGTDESRHGGTVVIALPAEPDVLNSLVSTSAYSGQILALVQDGLAEMDEEYAWQPRIASGWDVAADGLSVTFHLRPWVWEDGASLTARDIVRSFELFRDPVVASPRAGLYRSVLGAVALDSATVRFDLDGPQLDPLWRTVHAILPAHRVDHLDPADVRAWPLNRRPLASGPFRLQRWKAGAEIVLEPNPRYPLAGPLLDRIVFRIIPDETARFLALEAGDVDVVEELPPQAAARLAAGTGIEVHRVTGRVYGYVSYNFDRPLFRDARVRRAISLAIDRERLVDGLLHGYGRPAGSPLPPAVWNHHADLLPDPHAPARAESLLAAAGWADLDGDGVRERAGERLSFELITRKGDPVRENGAVILRDNLAAVGIDLQLRVMEHAAGLDRVRERRFDAYLGHFSQNLLGDPSSLLLAGESGRFNYGGYASAVVDSLLAVALGETDRAAALPVWRRLQEEVAADPPAAYLYYPDVLVGVNRRIRDARPHVLSPYNNLVEWWIAPADRKYASQGR
ncbi:MAG: ABC transporter substrate-binding protein [Candidatus Krumholzibacteriia bacterium]